MVKSVAEVDPVPAEPTACGDRPDQGITGPISRLIGRDPFPVLPWLLLEISHDSPTLLLGFYHCYF